MKPVAAGSLACQLSIAHFGLALALEPIGNRKSKNPKTHPLSQVVLTSGYGQPKISSLTLDR